MKKLYPLLLILLALYGCVQTSNKKNSSNMQQEYFDSILAQNEEKSDLLGNDIVKKEFNDSVKLAIGKYMDSVKLFVNWEAQIHNINSIENEKYIALEFQLKYAPQKYREVTFTVGYALSKDSLDSDKIYKTVKNINNYSTVYFDGFIRTKANGEAHYDSWGDDLMHSYPDFKFFVVDINTTSKGDTLSENLQNAVDLSFKAIEPIKLDLKKKMSPKESIKRVNKIAPQLKATKEALTQEEKAYINRLTEALMCNIVYAE